MQVGDPVLREHRCIQREQGALVRPVEVVTSIGMSVPPAAWVCLSKAWGTAAHTGLPYGPGMRGQGWLHAGLCSAVPLSGAKPTLPFPPQPPKTVRREVSSQVTALWSRTCKQGAEQGGGGCLGVCVSVCVCAHISSLKHLLLVCSSSRVTSAETGVHQRQPRDDKSPERLQREFWASTSGIPRSISFQVKWKTITIFFVCKIFKLSFRHCKYPGFPGESRGRMGSETGKGRGWLVCSLWGIASLSFLRFPMWDTAHTLIPGAGSVQLEMGFQHQHVLWVGSPQKWVTPESSLPSVLRVLLGMELISSDEEWKPLCPRKEISSDFSEMEFARNTLEGLDWYGTLQFLSDFIFPKCLQWDLYREL